MQFIKTAAVCSALALAPATTAIADATSQVTSSALQRLASQRVLAGLNPLQRNARLDAAARARAAGYCYRALAENIAWGIPSSDQVVEGWLNSPGHRRNILTPQLREYGLAGADGYWVMVIGQSC